MDLKINSRLGLASKDLPVSKLGVEKFYRFWEDTWIDQTHLENNFPSIFAISLKKKKMLIVDCWDNEN